MSDCIEGRSRVGQGAILPLLKITTLLGSLAILVLTLGKSQSFQAIIQFLAIIGPPAKRH